MSRKPVVSLRPDSGPKVYCLENRLSLRSGSKKQLDSYQLGEVRFVLNCLFQAVEREIVVSYADRPKPSASGVTY